MNTHCHLFGSHSDVSKHASSVAGFARHQLSTLYHANGQPVVRLHQPFNILSNSPLLDDPGPVIGLTLFEPNGSPIGHNHVERLSTITGIQLRTGGMCYTGVSTRVSGVDDDELKELYKGGRVCGDRGTFFFSFEECLASLLIRLR
jgi:hypothetical protein